MRNVHAFAGRTWIYDFQLQLHIITYLSFNVNKFCHTFSVYKNIVRAWELYMYINIDSSKGCKFFWKVLSFYTHYHLSVPPYQQLSTGSGSILGAGASRAPPGISIGRIPIVVVRMPYIWSYVSVLPYRLDFGLGNWTRDMLPVFWSPHQGAGPFLLDLQF